MRQTATRTRAGVTTSYTVLSSQLFGERKTVYKRRARPLATASCTTTIQVSAGRAELTWQLPRSPALAVLLPDGWTPRPVFINRTVRPSVCICGKTDRAMDGPERVPCVCVCVCVW